MTDVEALFMNHIKANAAAWRWKSREILASAEWYASIDPHQLSRLPQLLQEEIDKHKAKKKETT